MDPSYLVPGILVSWYLRFIGQLTRALLLGKLYVLLPLFPEDSQLGGTDHVRMPNDEEEQDRMDLVTTASLPSDSLPVHN